MTKHIRVPAIDLTEAEVGETIMITARCGGQYSVSRYVPGVDLLRSRAAVVQETQLILITELALRILKDNA